MVVYNKSKKLTLAAAASEVSIWKYVVPKGFKITILEIGFLIPDDGRMDGYLDEVQVDKVYGKLYPPVNYRSVVNRELEAGQEWEFKGSSTAGGDAGVLLIYDKVKI